MAVRVEFTSIDHLTAVDRRSMQGLLAQHFLGVDCSGFAQDLDEKTHVLRLLDDDRLVGFSTLDYRRSVELEGALLYSGDTIVDPDSWEAAELGAAWVAAVLDLHRREGGGALWWLLLSSGSRSYRYLSLCLRRYAPAPPERLDATAAGLLPTLAGQRFGEAFDAASGIVRLPRPQVLRPHLHAIADQHRDDASTALFRERNPGAAEGDELVSLCRLEESNLTRLGLRALRRGRGQRSGPELKAAPQP